MQEFAVDRVRVGRNLGAKKKRRCCFLGPAVFFFFGGGEVCGS